jgi:hypothetical protein
VDVAQFTVGVPLALDQSRPRSCNELLALVARYQRPAPTPTHLLGIFLTPAQF